MQQGERMKIRGTGDFAVVGLHESKVFLEANEWDVSIGQHYAVTIYLEPGEALRLSEELNLCATGVLGEKN